MTLIVAVTGHRPSRLGGYEIPNPTFVHVCRGIKQALVRLEPAELLTGMALGVDQWAAAIALSLGIPFTAAVPCDGQERLWRDKDQAAYRALLSKAKAVIVVSPGEYLPWKMQARNQWMVDRADTLIAVWDGNSGGTANCIGYARKLGKEIVEVPVS